MNNTNNKSFSEIYITSIQTAPLKYQIPGRFAIGLLVASSNAIGLLTASSLFSLPIIVPVIATIAAVQFTLGFFPEIGLKLSLPLTIVASVINISQLGIAFISKTTLLFTLTFLGLNFISMLGLGIILGGTFLVLSQCCCC